MTLRKREAVGLSVMLSVGIIGAAVSYSVGRSGKQNEARDDALYEVLRRAAREYSECMGYGTPKTCSGQYERLMWLDGQIADMRGVESTTEKLNKAGIHP